MNRIILGFILITNIVFGLGVDVSLNVKVVDDEGAPVEDAQVTIIYQNHGSIQSSPRSVGMTSEEGMFSGEGNTRLYMRLFVEKPGFYESKIKKVYTSVKEKTITLKKIKNPTKGYMKQMGFKPLSKEPPELLFKPYEVEETVEFDLMIGDYLPPYGRGKVADFVIYQNHNRKGSNNFNNKYRLSFSNEYDGIQEMKIVRESHFKSPYEAPVEGYEKELEKYGKRNGIENPPETNVLKTFELEGYFIRVRTVVDEEGNIISAHYGKIYGDFPGRISYYLNPTSLDRNIEFDPSKNLISIPKRDYESVVTEP